MTKFEEIEALFIEMAESNNMGIKDHMRGNLAHMCHSVEYWSTQDDGGLWWYCCIINDTIVIAHQPERWKNR